MIDSCALHDIQSVLGWRCNSTWVKEDWMQEMLSDCYIPFFSLYHELQPRWKRIVKLVWEKTHETQEEMPADFINSIEAPKDLLKVMQEALVTCWWTIGSLAILTAKHLQFFMLLAKGICNMTKTIKKDKVVTSNLLLLASSEWIVGDVFFIAAIAKSWLNPHMKFFQGPDPNVGEPGFLSYHPQVHFFLMMEDINRMKRNWRGHKAFSKFANKVDKMTNKRLRKLKEENG
jgi:hypothetical protein